jgi:hypothetical protein
MRDKEMFQNLRLNLGLFTTTFPVIPTIVMLVIGTVYLMNRQNLSNQQAQKSSLDLLPYVLFFALYITALSLMGYYSRRLTLGPYIFLELLVIKFSIQILGMRFNKSKGIAITLLLILLIGSWIGTNGPLE